MGEGEGVGVGVGVLDFDIVGAGDAEACTMTTGKEVNAAPPPISVLPT